MEARLFEEFKRWAVQLSEYDGDDDWYWYLLLQHTGGATRLLDWSDGALMALHFAVRNPEDDDKKADAFVYVLESYRLVAERLEPLDRDTEGALTLVY